MIIYTKKTSFLFFLFFSFFIYNQHAHTITASKESSDHSTPNKEIIWAGLLGAEPAYFEYGPNQGKGHKELDTFLIRKNLEANGYKLKYRYLTYSRLEYEIKHKKPLCFYEYTWSDPKTKFKHKPDRIYSFPIIYSGNEQKKIIILKENEELFKPYLLENGNIDIKKLIEANKLRTILTRNKSYGIADRYFFNKGDSLSDLKPELQAKVFVFDPSTLDQSLMMLEKTRIDYIFSNQVESSFFNNTKLNISDISFLTYESNAINDIYDPNLVFHSVVCSTSEVTKSAMPIINTSIQLIKNSLNLYDKIVNYKKSMNSFDMTEPFWGVLKIALQGQSMEDVFQKQNGYFQIAQSDKTAEKVEKISKIGKIGKVRKIKTLKKGEWLVFSDKKNFIHIINNAEYNHFLDIPAEYNNKYAIPISQVSTLTAYKSIHKITINASGMSEQQARTLIPLLKLPELAVYSLHFAARDIASILLKDLNPLITSLSLNDSVLIDSKTFLNRLRSFKKLRTISLNNALIRTKDFNNFLDAFLPHLEHLYVDKLKNVWTLEAARKFGNLKLPNLKTLSIADNLLDDRHLSNILKAVSVKNIEKINIDNNPTLTYKPIFDFLQRDPKKLNDLSIRNIRFPKKLDDNEIQLPNSMTKIAIHGMGNNLPKIVFNGKIKSLDLSYNGLSDHSLKKITSLLDHHIETLSLAGNSLDGSFLVDLCSRVKSIETLNISRNKLDDDIIKIFTNTPNCEFKVNNLNLSSNKFSDKGFNFLTNKIFKTFKEVDFSQNNISMQELNKFFKNYGTVITQLNLAEVAFFDLQQIIEYFPKNLYSLNLAYNYLTDKDIGLILQRITKNLRHLNISGSLVKYSGFEKILNRFRNLSSFSYIDTAVDHETGLMIFNELPETLMGFFPSFLEVNKDDLIYPLPPFLKVIGFAFTFSSKIEKSCKDLVDIFPISLINLETWININYNCLKSFEKFKSLRYLTLGISLDQQNNLLPNEQIDLDTVDFFILGTKSKKKELFNHLYAKMHKKRYGHYTIFQDADINQQMVEELRSDQLMRLQFFNCNLANDALDILTKTDLKRIKAFTLRQSDFPIKKLIKLLKKLPPYIENLELNDLKIEFDEVDDLIEALPKYIKHLNIAGLTAGKKGFEKFLQYKEKQEKVENVYMGVY